VADNGWPANLDDRHRGLGRRYGAPPLHPGSDRLCTCTIKDRGLRFNRRPVFAVFTQGMTMLSKSSSGPLAHQGVQRFGAVGGRPESLSARTATVPLIDVPRVKAPTAAQPYTGSPTRATTHWRPIRTGPRMPMARSFAAAPPSRPVVGRAAVASWAPSKPARLSPPESPLLSPALVTGLLGRSRAKAGGPRPAPQILERFGGDTRGGVGRFLLP
jgi:hypothetical protein